MLKTRILPIVIIIVSIAYIIVMTSKINTNTIQDINIDVNVLENISVLDKKITNESTYGFNAVIGQSYNVGDTVVYNGMAIKPELVGYAKNIEELPLSQLENRGFIVFDLTIINKNLNTFKIEEDSIQVLYGKITNWVAQFNQSVHNSGNDQWKYFEGSFSLDDIPSQTIRTGRIYLPVTDNIKDGGYLKIIINNIPLYFKF